MPSYRFNLFNEETSSKSKAEKKKSLSVLRQYNLNRLFFFSYWWKPVVGILCLSLSFCKIEKKHMLRKRTEGCNRRDMKKRIVVKRRGNLEFRKPKSGGLWRQSYLCCVVFDSDVFCTEKTKRICALRRCRFINPSKNYIFHTVSLKNWKKKKKLFFTFLFLIPYFTGC